MEIFNNDDQGYQLWLNQNPNGFVLNANNPPNARYLVAHRASCFTINGTPSRGKDWTKKYIKVCANKLSEISGWTQEKFGCEPYCCRHCSPE
jgi:hypothetical protein